jgi:hypothetical protein
MKKCTGGIRHRRGWLERGAEQVLLSKENVRYRPCFGGRHDAAKASGPGERRAYGLAHLSTMLESARAFEFNNSSIFLNHFSSPVPVCPFSSWRQGPVTNKLLSQSDITLSQVE